MEVARRFYGKLLPELGFASRKSQARISIPFIPPEATSPRSFSASPKIKVIGQTEHGVAFWADTREEVDRIAELMREAGGKTLEGPEICADYSPGLLRIFFDDPDGNKLEICCGKVRSLRNERISARSLGMSNPAHVPAILQEPRRHRYLKLIALLQIGKACCCFCLEFRCFS